jgi:hypothetical protein
VQGEIYPTGKGVLLLNTRFRTEVHMTFDPFIMDPATLMVLIFGLVEFAKQLGVNGNVLRWLSL